jgi:drug/metabolite transporter (DMT)-like permease
MLIKSSTLAYGVLLLVAAIWGSGFVAQRAGLVYLQPFSFNFGRFLIAALALLPLWFYQTQGKASLASYPRVFWWGSLIAGTVMFLGFSFQQAGLQYTTAGNAGFITSMYIVLVPLLGLLIGQATNWYTWVGISVAVIGLYQLSLNQGLAMNRGDVLELIGALFWALHVLAVGWLARRLSDLVAFSIGQFVVASVWAGLVMGLLEQPKLHAFVQAWQALFYSGVIVSGLAFTLQVMAQRSLNASMAALILSLEAVFALLAGHWLLNEPISTAQMLGGGLMLLGMLLSQWAQSKTSSVDS